jgi:hypothetical protein
MPPKKAAKNTPADAILGEKVEQWQGIKRQCEAYERTLQITSEQLQRSQLEKLNLKKKIVELNDKFKQEEGVTATMSHDMFRVYTSVQHQLIDKIEAHQSTIRGLRADLDNARLALEATKASKDAECAEKTKKINQQKQEMEEMAIRFGTELKATLEQMSHHIQGDKSYAAREEEAN